MGIKTLVLAILLLATPAMAGEEVSVFPDMEDYEMFHSEIMGNCPDGRAVNVSYYSNPFEPLIQVHLVYVEPDFEDHKVMTWVDQSDDLPTYDIYVEEVTSITWYKSVYAFTEDYPQGLCGGRIDQQKS